jgi:hypothetical protein
MNPGPLMFTARTDIVADMHTVNFMLLRIFVGSVR